MSKLGRLCICAFSLTAAMAADPVSGEAVYQRRCSGCHEQISPRIPNIAALKQMPATRILRTLDFGAMMSIAYPLNRTEREAVAAYIGTAAREAPPPPEAFCRDRKVTLSERSKFVWNGWSPALANTRFQSAEATTASEFVNSKTT